MKFKQIMQKRLRVADIAAVTFQLLYYVLLSRNKRFAFPDAPCSLIKFFHAEPSLATTISVFFASRDHLPNEVDEKIS